MVVAEKSYMPHTAVPEIKQLTQELTMATTKKTTSKETKPTVKKKETGKTPVAAKKAPVRETLTAEEKARVKKLKETLALLKADPEWPKFLEEQKLALLNLRDEMLPNMQNVTRDHLRSGASNVSSSSGQHIGDAGSKPKSGISPSACWIKTVSSSSKSTQLWNASAAVPTASAKFLSTRFPRSVSRCARSAALP